MFQQDVRYDPVSAQRAIDRLHQTARDLEDLTRARERLAEAARPGWQGAGREGFERRLLDLGRRSEELVHDLRRAATTIEEDLRAARWEQRRREQLRVER